jgi:uncharacterized protein
MTTPTPPRTAAEIFNEHLLTGEIRFQRCSSCGTVRATLPPICHRCLSPRATWEPASPTGQVSSYIVARQPIATELETPYVVVHVELDDGVRYTANLIGADPRAVHVGARVRFMIAERHGRLLPQFELDARPS